jgi:hypothetical protein
MEAGLVASDPYDVERLLALYKVAGKQERDLALALARESGRPGWWHAWSRHMPAAARHILEIEAAATVVYSIDPVAVPSLLQTPEYATAVVASSPFRPYMPWRGGLTATALSWRQDPALGPRRFVWAVIDEAVLRRAPGGDSEILADQIASLIARARTLRVTVQIAPDGSQDMLVTPGAFTIARLPCGLPDVVILEQLTTLQLVDSPVEVDTYKHIRDRIGMRALTPADSLELLQSTERALRHRG